MIGIIGKKLGMTQIFNEQGQQIPVTVIEAEPNPVLAVTDKAKVGHASCSSARHAAPASRVDEGRDARRRAIARRKAAVGHAKKAGLDAPPRMLRSVRLDEPGNAKIEIPTYNVGDIVKVDIFAVGDTVKVTGTSKGRGFQGVVKRYGIRRRTEHARQHEAPSARLHRTRHRSVARHQGQEDAGPLRRGAAHADASPRREDRRGAQSDLHPRLGRRSDRTASSSCGSRLKIHG